MDQKKIEMGSIYMGEQRILVVPIIKHRAGYRVESDEVLVVENEEDYLQVGNAILRAREIIENSPLATGTSKELNERAVWKSHSKYKSWASFKKHNMHVVFEFSNDEECVIDSVHRKKDGTYVCCIKEIILPAESSAEELGKAVMDVFEAVKEYYKEIKNT